MPRTPSKPATGSAVATVERGPSIRAAARRLSGTPDITKVSRSSGRGWQNQAWAFYDVIGEFRYCIDWTASMLSRASLYVARDGKRITAELGDDSQAAAYMEAFFGGPQAIGQMLKDLATHLTVAGECYIVGVARDGVERWAVVAATELTARGGKYYTWGKEVKTDSGKPLVIRVWRPHPRKWSEANAPARAVLPVLSQIDLLSKFVNAQGTSRLAGAGILLLPSEITLPGAQIQVDDEGKAYAQASPEPDKIVAALGNAMSASLQDREDASSIVPIILMGPGEHLEKAQHLTFWTDLQAEAKDLLTEAIRRMALGMDLPPEVVLGTADVNHWGSWAIEESAIKAHAEPLLALICDSLTVGFLRPLLIDDGMDPVEAERYTVEADTSQMRVKPDRSKEAIELYDRGALSLDAMLREVGFEPTDAPSPDEFARWLLKKIAMGQTTPEIVEAAARVLGADLGAPAATGDGEGTSPGQQARPNPSLIEHPQIGPPTRTTTDRDSSPIAGQRAASGLGARLDRVIAACEPIVFRALERVGNRLRNRTDGVRVIDCPPAEAYLKIPIADSECNRLLNDAFTNLDRYSICEQIPAERLEASLDAYVRSLLVNNVEYSAAGLAAYLTNQLAVAA